MKKYNINRVLLLMAIMSVLVCMPSVARAVEPVQNTAVAAQGSMVVTAQGSTEVTTQGSTMVTAQGSTAVAAQGSTMATTQNTAAAQSGTVPTQNGELPPHIPQFGYALLVNRVSNVVDVLGRDITGAYVPVKTMTCSVGKEGHETPTGIYTTSDYYEWRLMVDDTYGRYAVRFNGHILFHSVPYYRIAPDTLETEEYNKLGTAASLGCVRLSCEDSKWIYDNCPPGSVVVVYDDYSGAGMFGKPEPAKVYGGAPFTDWDPTDTNPSNPWNIFFAMQGYTREQGLEINRLTYKTIAENTALQ